MDDQNVAVSLIAPAKINGVREPAGKTVSVSPTLMLQLASSGAVNPDLAQQLSQAFDTSGTFLESDFQKAVEDAAAGRIEVLKADHLLEVAMLENQLFDLKTSELLDYKTATETALSSLNETHDFLREARLRVTELERQLELAALNAATLNENLVEATARAEKAEATVAVVEGNLVAEQNARAEAEKKLAEATAPKTSKPAK